MSHVPLTGHGDGLTDKTEGCGGTRDVGLVTHRVCLPFTDAGTQEAVARRGVETGFWERGLQGAQEDHSRLREGSWMYSRAVRAGETFSIQGESQVCVEELTWRQV